MSAHFVAARLRLGLPFALAGCLVVGIAALTVTVNAQPAQPAAGGENRPAANPAGNDNRPTAPAKLIDLIWKLKAGDSATYTVVDKTIDRTSDRGRQFTDTRTTTLDYEQKVDGVDEASGLATLKLNYKRIQFRQESSLNPQAPVTFDSNANEDLKRAELDPALMPFAALKDGAFSLKLSRKGDVSAVTGYSALVDRMFKGLEDPAFAALKTALKAQFSDEAMAQHLGQLYQALPGKAVPIGDQWKRDYEVTVALLGRLKVEQTFTLTGIETNPVTQHTIAVIAVQSRYTQLDPAGAAAGADAVQGLSISARLNDGSLNGNFKFDTDAGVMTNSDLRQELDSQLVAKSTESGVALTHEMNSKVSATITLTRN